MEHGAPPPRLYAFLLAVFFFPPLAFSLSCSSTCANLNLSYPFGAVAYCGYPGFQLSCASEPAMWGVNLLNQTRTGYYIVRTISINSDGVHGSVMLSWGLGDKNCSVVRANDTSMESSIFGRADLTAFDSNGTLSYTEADMYLLLGCENSEAAENLNETYCSEFTDYCPEVSLGLNQTLPNNGGCVPYQAANRSDLEHALDLYQCSYYRSFVNDSTMESLFRVGIQLDWTLQPASIKTNCSECEKSNGVCGYNSNGSDFTCYCGSGPYPTVCPGCTGISCTKNVVLLAVLLPVAVLFTALVVVFFVQRKRSKTLATRSVRGGSSHHYVTERGKSFAALFGPVAAREYSFRELEHATQAFSDERLLGDGGFGAVYQGRLYDNRQVAVKRLYHDNFKRMEQFYNEIRILSSLRHANLVKLYGYSCEDDRDLLLVFEYVSNGTVADHLYNPDAEPLPWTVRLKIALETAGALAYLHSDITPPIFHRDVKSTNILLEKDFHVKLADFGLSRLVPLQATHVSTLPQGTPGYLDPDYHHTYVLTDKSDVYSFGVVLMELISGLPAVDISRSRGEINLSSLAVSKILCGAWQELMDPRLKVDREPHVDAMVRNVAELAFRCLNAEKENRPTMEEVAAELACIKESGDREFVSPFSVDTSSGPKKSNQLINHTVSFSPNPTHSSIDSSYNSSTDSSSLLHVKYRDSF